MIRFRTVEPAPEPKPAQVKSPAAAPMPEAARPETDRPESSAEAEPAWSGKARKSGKPPASRPFRA